MTYRVRSWKSVSNNRTPSKQINIVQVIGTCQYVNQAGDQKVITAAFATTRSTIAIANRFAKVNHIFDICIYYLLITQRVNRVQTGSPVGWINPKEDTNSR
jgi:hypothetical protein